MTRRIAAATVIRGNGACQAFIDGVVHEEMRRQQECMEAERERAHVIEAHRDRLLAERVKTITTPKRRNLMQRLKDGLELIWAYFWAVTFGGVWIDMGETLGLWEYIGDEEEEHAER